MSTTVSNTITVSTAAELMSALANAKGGETILLAAGNYGELNLYDQRETFASFASEVTIKSADPNDLASFDRMTLRGVENLTFDTIKFDYDAAPGAAESDKPFMIRDSNSIIVRNSIFEGDMAEGVSDILDGHPTGHGLTVTGSSNITIENNSFYDFLRGAVFDKVDGLAVSGNEVYDIRGDGFNFITVSNVLIEGNYLHDFYGVTDFHRDMIQFWTNGTTSPSTDIIIRGNILDSGEGDWTQSIFMRNEEVDTGRAGLEMYYQNVLIEDNVIYNAHAHGITVGETIGLTIQNNTLLHNADSGDDGLVNIPTINVSDASQDVVIIDNIVPRLGITSADGRVVENNLIVQSHNPDGPNYVGDLFVNGFAGSLATLDDLRALPGGLIEQLGVGSSLTRFDTTPDATTGFILDESGKGLDLLTHSLDASAIFGPEGAADLSGATVVWDYGDGTSGTELTGSHTWQHGGSYNVTAAVTLANGETVNLAKTIEVRSPLAIHATFDGGAQDISDSGNDVLLGAGVTFEGSGEDQAMRLNGGQATYRRNPDFINNSEYTVQVDFKKDPGSEAAGGTLVYFSSSFVVNIGADGLNVMVGTDRGTTWLKPTGVGINDADWHRLALTFSGEDGNAILYIDGVEVARLTGLQGALQTGSSAHDLNLGHPTDGTQSFGGLIDNFQMWKGAMGADQIQALATLDPDGKFAPLPDTVIEPTGETVIEPTGGTVTVPTEETVTEPTSDDSSLDFSGMVFAQTIVGGDANEDLSGGNGDDYIDGAGGSDTLRGKNGSDVLLGGSGDDVLIGGNGDDVLVGGLGADVLTGGNGRDTFTFTTVAESPADATRDRIEDFAPGQDKIDVSHIDAIVGQPGNDAFVFIGTAAFSAAGQLRQAEFGRGGTMIEGDIDGDGTADFQIAIQIPGLVLTAEDFVV